jgi:hypothetical protein
MLFFLLAHRRSINRCAVPPALVSWTKVRKRNPCCSRGLTRESGYPEAFDFPGFRVALAIPVVSPVERASLPGMTIKLCDELATHHTSVWLNIRHYIDRPIAGFRMKPGRPVDFFSRLSQRAPLADSLIFANA